MTWDELIRKTRVGLREAKTHGALVERTTASEVEDNNELTPWKTLCLIQELALGLSNLHEACQALLLGLDALAVAWGELLPEEETEEVLM